METGKDACTEDEQQEGQIWDINVVWFMIIGKTIALEVLTLKVSDLFNVCEVLL